MIYQTVELEQHARIRKDGGDPEVLYWRYHNRRDVVDVILEVPDRYNSDGQLKDTGMRLLKYHCSNCHLIFGYDRPMTCPGCGADGDPMKPGKPGILVKRRNKG